MRALIVASESAPDAAATSALARALDADALDVLAMAREAAGAGPAAETAVALVAVEEALDENDIDDDDDDDGGRTAAVLVHGDGPAAPAAALVPVKLGIPAVRLGAGVRSGDRGSAEEIDRIVADRVCDLLLCADEGNRDVLLSEGLGERARVVGEWESDPGPAAREILALLAS